MNRQARFEHSMTWTDYGNIGFLDAATKHIAATNKFFARVQVRDEAEPDEIYTFRMQRRQVEFSCLNPRHGAK